jgi:hypothetical protein
MSWDKALALACGAVAVAALGLLFRSKEAGRGLGVIIPCRERDLDPERSVRAQRWCLLDRKGVKLLGRHPNRESALRQERLIHARKHGVAR